MMKITHSQFKEAIFPLLVEKLEIDAIAAMEMADKMWAQFRESPTTRWRLPRGVSKQDFSRVLEPYGPGFTKRFRGLSRDQRANR